MMNFLPIFFKTIRRSCQIRKDSHTLILIFINQRNSFVYVQYFNLKYFLIKVKPLYFVIKQNIFLRLAHLEFRCNNHISSFVLFLYSFEIEID